MTSKTSGLSAIQKPPQVVPTVTKSSVSVEQSPILPSASKTSGLIRQSVSSVSQPVSMSQVKKLSQAMSSVRKSSPLVQQSFTSLSVQKSSQAVSTPLASVKPVSPAVTVSMNPNEIPSIVKQPTLVVDPKTIQPTITNTPVLSQGITATLVGQTSPFQHEGHPTQLKKSKPTIQDLIENRNGQDINAKTEQKDTSEDTLNVEGSTDVLDVTRGSGYEEEPNTEIQQTATTLAKDTNNEQNTETSTEQPEKMIASRVEKSLEKYYEQHQVKHGKDDREKSTEDTIDKQDYEQQSQVEKNTGINSDNKNHGNGNTESVSYQTLQTPIVKIILDSPIQKQSSEDDFEKSPAIPKETAEITVQEFNTFQNKTNVPETIVDLKIGFMGERHPLSEKQQLNTEDNYFPKLIGDHQRHRYMKHKHNRNHKHKRRRHRLRHGHKKHHSDREEMEMFVTEHPIINSGGEEEVATFKDPKHRHKHRKHHRHRRHGERKHHKKQHRVMHRRKPHYDEEIFNHDSETEQEIANPELLTEEELMMLHDSLRRNRSRMHKKHRRRHRRRHRHKKNQRKHRRHHRKLHRKYENDQGLEYSNLQRLRYEENLLG